jgi:hypothetical protein
MADWEGLILITLIWSGLSIAVWSFVALCEEKLKHQFLKGGVRVLCCVIVLILSCVVTFQVMMPFHDDSWSLFGAFLLSGFLSYGLLKHAMRATTEEWLRCFASAWIAFFMIAFFPYHGPSLRQSRLLQVDRDMASLETGMKKYVEEVLRRTEAQLKAEGKIPSSTATVEIAPATRTSATTEAAGPTQAVSGTSSSSPPQGQP